MGFSSIGDLSQSFIMLRQSHAAKTDVTRLSQELSTGLKADVPKAVSNDFSVLSGIERALSLTETYSRAATEARVFTETAQASLGVLQDELTDFGPALLVSANSGSLISSASSLDAEQRLNTVIGALNTSSVGRRIFAGQATDTPPVASTQDILDALRPLVASTTTPEDMMAAVDAWFDPGGGFDTDGYRGSATPVAGFLVAENQTVDMEITADRAEIRDTLKALAKVALLQDVSFTDGDQARRDVLSTVGTDVMEAQGGVATLRAELGTAEEAIATADARNAAARSALQINRSELLGADPYEAATALEQASTQLESLYMITSRISRLKLSDYLR